MIINSGPATSATATMGIGLLTRRLRFLSGNIYKDVLTFTLIFLSLIVFGSYFGLYPSEKAFKSKKLDQYQYLRNHNSDVVHNTDNINISSSRRETAKARITKPEKQKIKQKDETSTIINRDNNDNNLKEMLISQKRKEIEEEMQGYKFQFGQKGGEGGAINLKELLTEEGGAPIRNVICTNWRSGSTFVGDVIESHPGTFYHYEPLMGFGVKQIRSENDEKFGEALNLLKNILTCGETKKLSFGLRQNTRIYKYCYENPEFCKDPEFRSRMCRLFPFHSMKVIRIRLRVAKILLEDPNLNIRLLFLIRDPRGTMNSRKDMKWCGPTHPDCSSPQSLCMDMEEDFHEAEVLRQQYPERFLAIRYEDVSRDPLEAFKKIFKFFRLQFHPKVEAYVNERSTKNKRGSHGIPPNSSTVALQWREDLSGNNFSFLKEIQNVCGNAMRLWGYKEVDDESKLLDFDVVGEPPWEEMRITSKTLINK